MKVKAILYQIKLLFYIPNFNLQLTDSESFEVYNRGNRVTNFTYLEKNSYMKSREWQTMQKIWLHKKGYRCQMFPFLILGKHKSVYGKYAIHHINKNAYKNLGKEELDRDVIVLSKFAHYWIYHYLLSFGKKRVSSQNVLKFPNPLQTVFNYWCILNKWLKLLFISIIILYFLL